MIDERQVREMLERRAEAISATPADAPKAIRRARRRLARNATVGAVMGLAVIAGAAAGLRMTLATPPPVRPATPPPSTVRLGSLAYGVDGDIYVAESDGSNPVKIADGRPPSDCPPPGTPFVESGGGWGEYWGEGPLWSPDGGYLAYRHKNCDRPPGAWRDVVISDPEGDLVAEFAAQGWRIAWSPDSTRVAVWVSFAETIGVFGVDGVRQALLTMPPGWEPSGDSDPVWLPDGESLRVEGARKEDPERPFIAVVPIDGSAPYELPLADLPAEGILSPDGARVVYTTRTSLVVAEADGSNPQEVFGDWPDMLEVIDFSPQGDRILFSREEDGVSSLWSINADGSDLRRLVAGTALGDWLSRSPTP